MSNASTSSACPAKTGVETAKKIVDRWLATPFDGGNGDKRGAWANSTARAGRRRYSAHRAARRLTRRSTRRSARRRSASRTTSN
ncbi:MAG: hypothetical protein R3F11_24870 [Verrucomicrobiales bacterium]